MESISEGNYIAAYFTLMDHGAVVRIDILDRILDRDDVLSFILVDVVNDRGKCCGLT